MRITHDRVTAKRKIGSHVLGAIDLCDYFLKFGDSRGNPYFFLGCEPYTFVSPAGRSGEARLAQIVDGSPTIEEKAGGPLVFLGPASISI